MKARTTVVKAIQRYDSKLFLKWNGEECFWEVWRKMPWGNRLITPVTESIYQVGADRKFAPLDYRIIDWLYSADSQRKDKHIAWRYRRKLAIKKSEENKWDKLRMASKYRAKDIYYLVNNELINLTTAHSNWKAPEVQSRSRNRVMYRKEYYEYDGN